VGKEVGGKSVKTGLNFEKGNARETTLDEVAADAEVPRVAPFVQQDVCQTGKEPEGQRVKQNVERAQFAKCVSRRGILQALETQPWRMLKTKSLSFCEIIHGLLAHKMLVRFLPLATTSLLRGSSLSLMKLQEGPGTGWFEVRQVPLSDWYIQIL